MKSLFLATLSILTMTIVIFDGKALAGDYDDGGFCRSLNPSAPICQRHNK